MKRIASIQDISCLEPLLADGGTAGDLRHGGGVRHRTHGGAQHPHHVPRLHQPGPVGPAAAHRPPLEKPERDPGRHLHRLSGLPRQTEEVCDFFDLLAGPDTLLFVDPAMAGGGRLYAGFGPDFPGYMRRVVARPM